MRILLYQYDLYPIVTLRVSKGQNSISSSMTWVSFYSMSWFRMDLTSMNLKHFHFGHMALFIP